jgi:hypothetical protein
MEIEVISKRLKTIGVVFICDDYEGVAIRLVADKNGIKAYAKNKGKGEFLTSSKEDFVFGIEQEGREMTKEEYDNY